MSCLECRWCDDRVRRNDAIKCVHPDSPWQWCDTDISCRRFTPKPSTVFSVITKSPEILSEMLVYSIKVAGGLKFMYSSRLIDKCYHRRANAVKATLAKLKEVAE